MTQKKNRFSHFRASLYTIIFGTDTKAGKHFDLFLLYIIIASILLVMLESVKEIRDVYHEYLKTAEWIFTVFFSVEYIARIISSKKPIKYIFSFFGVIDFLAIVPTYLTLFYTGGNMLIVIRAIRLLRVFRILHLPRFLQEAKVLAEALKSSLYKITVFLVVILSIVMIIGTMMYLIEDGKNGFTSIPRCIYWAIVTITTVGYGDIAPTTILGQTFAAILMLLGYVIIAVPTGIVTSEINSQNKTSTKEIVHCPNCETALLDPEQDYCHSCGVGQKNS